MFWFFRKKNVPLPGSIAEEEWKEGFSFFRKSRFKNEEAEKYNSRIIPGSGLVLTIKNENLFAWCEPPDYRYSDFDAQCSFSFRSREPGENMHRESYCSGGIIFRMGNDYNYYYFLVSSRGYYRVDCVFNSNPVKLLNWTRLSFELGEVNTLRVVAWGSHFLFFVNGIQVAKLADETISSGSVTFCGQNYTGASEASFLLSRFSVNSVPFDVEKGYSESSPIPDEQKLILARSFFDSGQFLPAAVQMKSYFENKDEYSADDSLLGFHGEILVNLGMLDEALEKFSDALAVNPGNRNYLLEKGNILYRLGRYSDLKEHLDSSEGLLGSEPLFWNLHGHSLYYLGRSLEAAESYGKASGLDDQNPFYNINTAKALEASGKKGEAAARYAQAAVLFFRQENYDDSSDSAGLALRNSGGDPAVRVKAETVLAKIMFQKGELKKAADIFKKLIESFGWLCTSDVFFLYGIIQLEKGKIRKAHELVKKACEKEDYYLYWYRLAGIERMEGKDPEETIGRAYALAPDDCWVNNMLGELSLEKGDLQTALGYFEKAFNSAESADRKIPALNYSEALRRSGSHDKAAAVLDMLPEETDVLIQKALIYELSGQNDLAGEHYRKAFDRENLSADGAEALASWYYRNEQYGKAEEVLASLGSLPADRSLLNLAGNLARIRGNFETAFEAYRKSLEAGFDPVVALNYIEGLCESLSFEEAEKKLAFFFPDGISSREDERNKNRYLNLKARIERETRKTLSCSSCGLKWTVPKNIKIDRTLRLVGEPKNSSPAGRCPSCGRIYCAGCASAWIDGGRYFCPECRESLKLSDDYLRYLAAEAASGSGTG